MPAIILRFRHAKSGTDVGCTATRKGCVVAGSLSGACKEIKSQVRTVLLCGAKEEQKKHEKNGGKRECSELTK
eukprot:2673660-Rhodomonas_salina.2